MADNCIRTGKSVKPNCGMSYEELKSKMLHRLQNRGIFNEMKAQMRSKLVHELYNSLPITNRDSLDADDRGMLHEQVSNWLICDHLQQQKYEFTLSTFLQESGIIKSPKKILSRQDVLFLLGVSNYCPLKTDPADVGESFLYTVIKTVLHMQLHNQKSTLMQQTWREQLRSIDEVFEKRKQLVQGDDAFHKILKEVEHLHACINREFQEKNKLVNCRVSDMENDLFQEKSQKTQEIANEAKNVRLELKESGLMKKLLAKEQQLRLWEEELNIRSKQMEEQHKAEDSVQRQCFQEEKNTVQELNVEMLVSKLQSLEEKNSLLWKNLEEMTDYKMIKSELNFAKLEAQSCMERFASAQREWISSKANLEHTISDLTMKLSNPCTELLKAHQELQKLQDAFKVERSVWNKQRNSLEKQLDEIKQLYQRALLRNESQIDQIAAQEKVVAILQQRLHDAEVVFEEKDCIITGGSKLSDDYFSKASAPENDATVSRYFDLAARDVSMSPPNFLRESKQRLEKIHLEAEQLENRYRHFVETKLLNFSPFQKIPLDASPNLISRFTNEISTPRTPVKVGNYHSQPNYELHPFQKENYSLEVSKNVLNHHESMVLKKLQSAESFQHHSVSNRGYYLNEQNDNQEKQIYTQELILPSKSEGFQEGTTGFETIEHVNTEKTNSENNNENSTSGSQILSFHSTAGKNVTQESSCSERDLINCSKSSEVLSTDANKYFTGENHDINKMPNSRDLENVTIVNTSESLKQKSGIQESHNANFSIKGKNESSTVQQSKLNGTESFQKISGSLQSLTVTNKNESDVMQQSKPNATEHHQQTFSISKGHSTAVTNRNENTAQTTHPDIGESNLPMVNTCEINSFSLREGTHLDIVPTLFENLETDLEKQNSSKSINELQLVSHENVNISATNCEHGTTKTEDDLAQKKEGKDESEDELQLSTGEQKSNSDDSFW